MSINLNELVNSRPYTVGIRQNNTLGDYIYSSNSNENTTCLDLILRSLRGGEKSLESFLTKVGEYNFKEASNPRYLPPYQVPYKDYIENCPEGWNDLGYGSCSNPDYKGPCWSQKKKCEKKWEQIRNDGYWVTDRVNNFANCPWGYNGSRPANNGECYAGWGWTYQEWHARHYCAVSRGTWIPKDYRYNAYTCRMPGSMVDQKRWVDRPVFDWVERCTTEPPSNFNGYSPIAKQGWENSCGAYWPTKQRNIEGRWECSYGRSLQDDVNQGLVLDLGSADNYVAAFRLLLGASFLSNVKYFAFANNRMYVPKNGQLDVFSRKGDFQPNCSQAGPKVTVYSIDNRFYTRINQCKQINDNINTVNHNLETFENKPKKEKVFGWD